jgi:hypothetical protein
VLGFIDQVRYLEELNRRMPHDRQEELNPVELTIRRVKEPEDKPPAPRIQTLLRRQFKPEARGGGVGPWRKLAVTVTPERTQVYWEDQLIEGKLARVKPLKRSELSRAKLTELSKPLMVEPLRPISDHPNFAPQGGLGLYVCRGAASFCLVTVEPLVGDD